MKELCEKNPQFNFSSFKNLSIERNLFKWRGKVLNQDRIWGKKVGITYYTYGLFFCTSLNSYEFLVTRATTTTRELHMLRQLYCYFVTLGAFLRNTYYMYKVVESYSRERETERTLNVTYSLILHWIQTSSNSSAAPLPLLFSDKEKNKHSLHYLYLDLSIIYYM